MSIIKDHDFLGTTATQLICSVYNKIFIDISNKMKYLFILLEILCNLLLYIN